MSSLIDKMLVLYTSLALLMTQCSYERAHAKPTSETSMNPEITSDNQNDPIRAIHYHFEQKMDPFMQLVKLNSSALSSAASEDTQTGGSNMNHEATCNDGSSAGYYKRLNSHSKSWIIYLQGGGFCGSEEACQHRWRRGAHLMTSDYWPNSISVEGILSSEPKDNPFLWNANHIYVPYCSSDSWTGLQRARPGDSSFAFMGSKIIEKVLESLFDDLPQESSLFEAKFILLAGDSAGATGVMMNLDRVNRFVQQRFANSARCGFEKPQLCDLGQVPIVRGIADSGWFLDNEPYDLYQRQQQQPTNAALGDNLDTATHSFGPVIEQMPVNCDRQRCSPLQSIKQAMVYWNGQIPAACARRYPNEPWRCYFGYRAYPSLRTPLFVVQWLYDEAQLMVDNIIRPGTISQWNYVNKLVNELRVSLENVTALFAPSCLSHSLIIKQSWNQININGLKLPHVLNSWEEEALVNQPLLEVLQQDELQHAQFIRMAARVQHQHLTLTSGNQVVQSSGHDQQLSDRLVALRQQREAQPASNQQQFELRSVAAQTVGSLTPVATTTTSSRVRNRKKRRNNQQSASRLNAITSNRLSRSTLVEEPANVFSNNVPDALFLPNARQQDDKFRLIDTCGWPQCNRDCPSLELDFNSRPITSYT